MRVLIDFIDNREGIVALAVLGVYRLRLADEDVGWEVLGVHQLLVSHDALSLADHLGALAVGLRLVLHGPSLVGARDDGHQEGHHDHSQEEHGHDPNCVRSYLHLDAVCLIVLEVDVSNGELEHEEVVLEVAIFGGEHEETVADGDYDHEEVEEEHVDVGEHVLDHRDQAAHVLKDPQEEVHLDEGEQHGQALHYSQE